MTARPTQFTRTLRATFWIAIALLATGSAGSEPTAPFSDSDRSYWAFQPVTRPPIPATPWPRRRT